MSFRFLRFQMIHSAVAVLLLSGLTVRAQQQPASPPTHGGEAKPPARPSTNFLVNGPIPDPEMVERGQKIYVANCGFCHGSSAKGGEGGPDLVRAVPVLHDEGGNLLAPIIQKGRNGMPAFSSMTLDQVKDIGAFLHSRTQAAANRMSYKILNVVTGDPKAGEGVFEQKCKSCHSPAGDLAGIGGKFSDPSALQNRFLYPGQGGGPFGSGPPSKPTQVTVRFEGKSFSGKLEYRDDFTLSLRDAQGTYHSFDTSKIEGLEVNDPFAGHARLLPLYTDKEIHDILAYLVTLK
jgi:mono/diheme cytochrome c family protein